MGEFGTGIDIKVINRTITKLDRASLPVKSGRLVVKGENTLKISMMHISRDKFANAFLKGFCELKAIILDSSGLLMQVSIKRESFL